ncbi:hypothetical protein CLOP_g23295 [Closterium sp. NIES-67]|nr:hypothetical protein CLOP_g23295 [Closterium sp. NIES-67]
MTKSPDGLTPLLSCPESPVTPDCKRHARKLQSGKARGVLTPSSIPEASKWFSKKWQEGRRVALLSFRASVFLIVIGFTMVAFSFNAIPSLHEKVSLHPTSSIEERSGPRSFFRTDFARAIFAESGYSIGLDGGDAADSQSGPCSTSGSDAGSAGSSSEGSGAEGSGSAELEPQEVSSGVQILLTRRGAEVTAEIPARVMLEVEGREAVRLAEGERGDYSETQGEGEGEAEEAGRREWRKRGKMLRRGTGITASLREREIQRSKPYRSKQYRIKTASASPAVASVRSSSSAFPSPATFIPLPPVVGGDAHPSPAPVKEQFLWRNPRSHGYAKCNAEGKKNAARKGGRKGSRGPLHSRLRGRPAKSAVEHAARAMAMAEWERKVQDPVRRKRVLILMSDTGGGHRASAEALKSTFEMEFGDKYEVNVVDMWTDHTPWPFNQLPKSYNFLVRHETLWKMTYYATKPKFVHQPQMAATFAFVARTVSKGLDKYKPDVIVSVHPLMQHIPLRVLKSRGLLHRIPFITVVTDLTTCHPTWFSRQVSVCFCPTKEVAQQALKAGLQPSQIRVHGLPIRPAFAKPSGPQAEVRQGLGMDPDLPAVLLIGGGEGMGPVEVTARALATTLAPETPGGQSERAADNYLWAE